MNGCICVLLSVRWYYKWINPQIHYPIHLSMIYKHILMCLLFSSLLSGTCVCRWLELPYLGGTCGGVVTCSPQGSPAPVGLTYNEGHVPQGHTSSPYWQMGQVGRVVSTWLHSCKAARPLELLQVTSVPWEEQTYLNRASPWSGRLDSCSKGS